MGVEIEHKYLVKNEDYKRMAYASHRLRQGYLNREPLRTVRVRTYDDKGFLTVKGKNKGDARLEFEYEIPYADAKAMLKLCEGKIVEKIRYLVDFEGMKWEVDEFEGALAGLTVAEVEIPESGHSYKLPPFVGENVTGDSRYYNSNL